MENRAVSEQTIGEWHNWLELAHKAGIKIGLWEWDVLTNTVTGSDESYRQFGFTHETFSGRLEDLVGRVHPQDRAGFSKTIDDMREGDREYASQFRVVWPDQTVCWIKARGVAFHNGTAVHMRGIGVDITTLKETEQSRQESEDRYLLLLNSTAEGIYGLDLEGNCTFCNPACLRCLGYQAPEELLGKNMHALMHHTRADGAPYPAEECRIYVAIREGEASHVAEEVLWRADGTSFQAIYWSYPMRRAGELLGAVVSFLDISELKRAEQSLRDSEETYRELFEHATYGSFRSNREGDFLDVNPALVAILGYGSKAELMACNLNRDIFENSEDRVFLLKRLEPSGRIDGVEVNWKRKDGQTVLVRLGGGQIRGKDGQVSHFEVIVEDITERRSLEAQYRQAQKMEAVGLLAGGISHDFNNHLSVILGNAELLLEKTQSGKLQHYAKEIKKATKSAAQLTRQLLAFSRKQVLYPTLLDLSAVVSDVVKSLVRLIGEDVQIVVEGETSSASIRADRGQIEQILMNLATNARDAMPNGGTFTLRTENAELGPHDVARYFYVRPGHYVRLSVSDTGMGMSEEILTHVFEPFFTTKPQGKGTGLGLATVYGIVKQSGGYVWISSRPGKGATFDIYLPRVDEAAPPLLGEPEGRSEYPKGTETILVLEDEEALRAVTCQFLTAGGYTVLQAGRGSLTIEEAQRYKGRIQLIISDVVLPDMSGPSVVERVQALHPGLKVLFVSGYAEVPVAQKLIEEGFLLLQKPVSRSALMKTVDELLHLHTVAPSASCLNKGV
jgi:two-component system, NtrC family, sensor kinase